MTGPAGPCPAGRPPSPRPALTVQTGRSSVGAGIPREGQLPLHPALVSSRRHRCRAGPAAVLAVVGMLVAGPAAPAAVTPDPAPSNPPAAAKGPAPDAFPTSGRRAASPPAPAPRDAAPAPAVPSRRPTPLVAPRATVTVTAVPRRAPRAAHPKHAAAPPRRSEEHT